MANTEWIENMKKIVLQAMEAGDPCDVIPGVVTGEAPLTVQIDQKTILFNSQLLVPKRLTDHTETMVLPEAGEVNVTVKGELKAGEKVLMIQKKGGQQYLIIDRW